jgi:hypothetical protein
MQGKYNNDKNKLESKPVSEQQAFAYQTKWLQTKDPKVWEEWTALMFSYTRSLVLKKLTRKKYLEPDEIDDITADAVFNFMAQYLKPTKTGGQFEVGASFAGMVNFKILEALYRGKDDSHILSLDAAITDENKTLADFAKPLKVEGSNDSFLDFDLTDIVEDLLDEIDKRYSNDIYLASILKLYVNLILKCPKQAATKNKFVTLFQVSDKHIEFIYDFFKKNAYRLNHSERY